MEQESAPRAPLRCIAARVGYDGTDYCGFQVQAAAPTIQGALEQALRTFTTVQGRVAGAGRTDSGVHARGQVISVAVYWRHGLDALQRAWNAHLPPAIVIHQLADAPAGFHPRFSATQRTYRYFVLEQQGGGREPLSSRYALDVAQPLDVAAMAQAAGLLVGRRDFATFGKPPQGESTVRTVLAAQWQVEQTTLPLLTPVGTRRLVFTISADAFLQHMVRKLVGALLLVGAGQWAVADFAAALHAADSARAAPPAPACGLVLEAVTYPAHLTPFAPGAA